MPLSTNFYDAVTHLLLGPPNHLNNGPRTLSITLAAATTVPIAVLQVVNPDALLPNAVSFPSTEKEAKDRDIEREGPGTGQEPHVDGDLTSRQLGRGTRWGTFS